MICKSNDNSYHDGASTFFDAFFEKDLHLNAVEYSVIFDFKIELSEQEIKFYEFFLSPKKKKKTNPSGNM